MTTVKPLIGIVHPFLPDGVLARWSEEFASCEFVDVRDPKSLERHLARITIAYGLPPIGRLAEATRIEWIQLLSAGVPGEICPLARARSIPVTNLAGLYGPTIAEHALALMLMVMRNLHVAGRNQQQRAWDRSVAHTMGDLHGKTLGVVGLGNIGRNIARLARAFGMRVLGVRRTPRPTPQVDRVYPVIELHAMLAQADIVAVAAPLTRQTEGMLGRSEFEAMKPGAVYVNVSRGQVAQEDALVAALQSGRLRGAGIDAFATEPLPGDHPLWSLPNVVVSPHYSGETVNKSTLPAERFARNLRAHLARRDLEGRVDLDLGY